MRKIGIGFGVSIIFLFLIFYVKGNLEILDINIFYSKSFIDSVFEALGPEGRATYSLINILDFFFIFSITATLVSAYKMFFKKDDLYKSLLWVPVIFCIADHTETGIVFYLIKIYPETSKSLKTLLVIATPVKWFFALSSALVLVNGYLLQLYIKKME